MSDELKPTHYALIIDQRRNLILSALLQSSAQSETGRFIFQQLCNQEGITKEEVGEFIEDWSKREHDLGWCKDPNCLRKI